MNYSSTVDVKNSHVCNPGRTPFIFTVPPSSCCCKSKSRESALPSCNCCCCWMNSASHVGGSSAVSDLLRVRGWATNRNDVLLAADGGRPSPPESLCKDERTMRVGCWWWWLRWCAGSEMGCFVLSKARWLRIGPSSVVEIQVPHLPYVRCLLYIFTGDAHPARVAPQWRWHRLLKSL